MKQQNATAKQALRKAEFVAVATNIINRRGVSGMALADVAADIGLAPKASAYYFRRKEDLATACFLDAIQRIQHLIALASERAQADMRLADFLALFFDLRRRAKLGEIDELTALNDVRALNSAEVNAAFVALFRDMRALISDVQVDKNRLALSSHAHLILAHCHWSAFWLIGVLPDRYPKVCDRLTDIIINGLAAKGQAWEPLPLITPELEPSDLRGKILNAATKLINRQGYHGASIDKISTEVGTTKGGFYHHMSSKDEMILACFDRSLSIIRETLLAAEDVSENAYQALAAIAAHLVTLQIRDGAALLRMSALTTLPENLQIIVIEKYQQIVHLLASIISDGIIDGSLRPVDATLSAQLILGMLNSADELPTFVPSITTDDATASYVKPCFVGFFS
jgi:AcrR family transcriptional regulator